MKIKFSKEKIEDVLEEEFCKYWSGAIHSHLKNKKYFNKNSVRIEFNKEQYEHYDNQKRILCDSITLTNEEIASLLIRKYKPLKVKDEESPVLYLYKIISCEFKDNIYVIEMETIITFNRKTTIKVGGGSTTVNKTYYGPQKSSRKRKRR